MLTVVLYSVRMPEFFGIGTMKTMGRPLSVMAHLKKSIVQVKPEMYCLAHALIVAIVKVTNDPDYTAYRNGR